MLIEFSMYQIFWNYSCRSNLVLYLKVFFNWWVLFLSPLFSYFIYNCCYKNYQLLLVCSNLVLVVQKRSLIIMLYLIASQRRILGPAATSKMECFLIIVNAWKPLTIITRHSILDVAAALDPPLRWIISCVL